MKTTIELIMKYEKSTGENEIRIIVLLVFRKHIKTSE